MFWREYIPKEDQVAVPFCLTSTVGLVGSSSLSTASSSACFSLSFFFFFFLTGSPSSKAVPSVPQKGQKGKEGCQLLRLQKEKLWDVRGCNDSYLPSALPLPAELLPAIIKIYKYIYKVHTTILKTWVTVFRQHYSHLLVNSHHTIPIYCSQSFKTSLHVFICLPNYLQALQRKRDCPQFGKYFYTGTVKGLEIPP